MNMLEKLFGRRLPRGPTKSIEKANGQNANVCQSPASVWLKDEDERREISQELRLAISMFNSDQKVKARQTFDQQRSVFPDFDVPQLWYAKVFRSDGRDQDAVDFLQGIVAKCRRRSYLLAEIAEIYGTSSVIRNVSKSIEYWGRAAFAGKNVYAWGILAVLFYQCDMLDAVKFATRRFREIEPNCQMNANEVVGMFGDGFQPDKHRHLLQEVFCILQGSPYRELQQKDERVVGEIWGKPVKDMRDDKERQIARDAYVGKSLGPDVDRLVTELIQIGRTDDYLSMTPGVKFNEYRRNIRACEIGEVLNERGGMDLMQAAYYRVRAALPVKARALECAWGGIGEWLS